MNFRYPKTIIAVGGLMLAISGCATQNEDGVTRRYSFGVTVVTIPKSAPARPDFSIRDVTTYGVAVGVCGAAIGYSHLQVVSLPPEGAVHVQVRTPEEFQKVKKLIKNYPNKNICVSERYSRW